MATINRPHPALHVPHDDPGRMKSRKFDPKTTYPKNISQDAIEVRDGPWVQVGCPTRGKCIDCGQLHAHSGCLIIAVDGTCRNQDTATAAAAVGVFVGGGSNYNVSKLLSTVDTSTPQQAELLAAFTALKKAQRIAVDCQVYGGLKLYQVVIKAHSEYLVKSMTEWIFKWEKNGYKTSKGAAVSNAKMLKAIDKVIQRLNESDVEVLFWQVPKGRNQDAEKLANEALDRAGH